MENSMENRSSFLREIVAGIRAEAPGLEIGVRMSIFDWMLFKKDTRRNRCSCNSGNYNYGFWLRSFWFENDLTEPLRFLQELKKPSISNCFVPQQGSPITNPHIQAPGGGTPGPPPPPPPPFHLSPPSEWIPPREIHCKVLRGNCGKLQL